ncbi:hypothetical protein IFT82_08375 [Sphingomonas sp. CFBP 8760]|nr:hypothetical protein [Sphingomonas sp. CFBP 8760]
MTMPVYRDAWRLDAATGAAKPRPAISETIVATDKRVRFAGTWRQEAAIEPAHHVTDERGSSFSVTFTGTQASLISVARPDGGYAYITLRDRHGKELMSSTVDMYSKYPVSEIKFVTPLLARGTYTISASVVGDGWYWHNKKGERSGSAGHTITFERAKVRS